MNIANTGERILLEKETPLMIARHFCAYKFAGNYITDKNVLDIGCGEGYGSYYLANLANQVTGVDYDQAIIDYATEKYRKNNLNFCVMDAKDLGSLNDKFDAICAFQFIEHLQNTEALLGNIKNLLKNGGIFICSTPNKKDASPGSDLPLNKFHVREYLLDEFRELFLMYFTHVIIFSLKRGRKLDLYRGLKKSGLCVFLPAAINPVKRFYSRITCDNFVIVKDNLDTALDFIVVCKD